MLYRAGHPSFELLISFDCRTYHIYVCMSLFGGNVKTDPLRLLFLCKWQSTIIPTSFSLNDPCHRHPIQANKDAATAPIGGGTSQDQRNEVGSCTKKTCMRCLKIYVYITCHPFHECRVWVFDAVYKCWVMIYPFWVFLYKLKRLVSNPVRPSNRLRNSSTVFCRKPERSEG